MSHAHEPASPRPHWRFWGNTAPTRPPPNPAHTVPLLDVPRKERQGQSPPPGWDLPCGPRDSPRTTRDVPAAHTHKPSRPSSYFVYYPPSVGDDRDAAEPGEPVAKPHVGIEINPSRNCNGAADDGDEASSTVPEIVEGKPLYAASGSRLEAGDHARVMVVQGYRDLWAAVFFAAMVATTIALAIKHGTDPSWRFSSRNHRLLTQWVPVAIASAFGFAPILLALVRFLPRLAIVGAMVLQFCFFAALTIYMFTIPVWWMVAFIPTLFLMLYAWCCWSCRRSIPLASALLSHGALLVTRYWGCLVVDWLCLAAGIAYCFAWIFMCVPLSDLDGWWMIGGGAGALCAVLWATQVCANVAHVTTSGVVATWFFAGQDGMPMSPTIPSFRRAMTTSFGSICFGSLLVAIIKTLYVTARVLSRARGRGAWLACIGLILLFALSRLIPYLNIYAFTHVAIYGSSYLRAAKQSWDAVEQYGDKAVMNDSLVWPVITMATVFPAIALSLLVGFVDASPFTGCVVFVVTFASLVLLLRPVYAAVVTQFVCLANHETAYIREKHPAWFWQIDYARSVQVSAD